MSRSTKCVKSFWLDCDSNQCNVLGLTSELTFSEHTKFSLKFSLKFDKWNVCFSSVMSPKPLKIDQKYPNFDPKPGEFTNSKNENHVNPVLFHNT